ncbi:glycosyltransferase [Methylobacterium nonmethylotrophicum]|uniref:Glycosyltransferase family 4 protein n=1 Tax=Methylobacterium nonmethylotrophicum TaxID=1141884 RepID=A0A4Z0NHI1_9HYPH|nr:glycosyltransferase [Methylobacterium nonmethylotrophicum]TGD95032.1 glycosyltransferase family 4 protein [Methylobacterium nonmethylotrophicum]
MKSLTILSVAYPFAPVSPDSVGGAEQVLARLDAALAATGHRSVVVARAGSRVAGTLVPVPAEDGPIDDAARARAHARHRAAIAQALRDHPVDLLHLHGIDFFDYLPPPGLPVLATLHLPPSWYPPQALRPERPRTWLHGVSAAQARACTAHPALLPPIPNGVPVDILGRARHAKRGFALALGRVCPEKGFHHALAAAHRGGFPLLIGGQVYDYPVHQAYFRDEIAPRLDRHRRFLGPLGFARKRRLLAAARCLIVPSLAPETSSLVAMEAMACGTPVVAYPSGALPEIVEPGRTGFLVQDEAGLAEAVARAGALDPEDCRQAARGRFSDARMAGAYLARYREILAR